MRSSAPAILSGAGPRPDWVRPSDSWKQYTTSPPIEPHRDRAGVRIEAFGLAEGDGGGAELAERTGIKAQNGGALHAVEHAEPRGEPRRAGSRQHMVGAGHIVP